MSNPLDVQHEDTIMKGLVKLAIIALIIAGICLGYQVITDVMYHDFGATDKDGECYFSAGEEIDCSK
jgi:hypothetical protein